MYMDFQEYEITCKLNVVLENEAQAREESRPEI